MALHRLTSTEEKAAYQAGVFSRRAGGLPSSFDRVSSISIAVAEEHVKEHRKQSLIPLAVAPVTVPKRRESIRIPVILHRRAPLLPEATKEERERAPRRPAANYVEVLEELANSAGSSREGTACSAGSRQGSKGSARQGSAGLSGGGRVSFSRRTARLKKGQGKPAVFNPTCLLASLPMFSGCSVDFLKTLQEYGGPLAHHGKIFEADVTIVVEKQLAESMWVVHRGELEVIKNFAQIDIIRELDCFGERVLLGQESRYTASLRTLTISHLLEIKFLAFMSCCTRYPDERHVFERMRPSKKDSPYEITPAAGQAPNTQILLPPVEIGEADSLRSVAHRSSCHEDCDDTQQRQLVCHSVRQRIQRGGIGSDVDDKLVIEQVRKSLTADYRRGFRLPNIEDASKQNRNPGEELGTQQDDDRLDIGLLPPISTMTALQKRMVQRQLELQVQARMQARSRARVQARDRLRMTVHKFTQEGIMGAIRNQSWGTSSISTSALTSAVKKGITAAITST